MTIRAAIVARLASVILAVAPSPLYASPIFTVTFNDPGNFYGSYFSALESNTLAAGRAWGERLLGDGTLEIVIGFSNPGPTAIGGSLTSSLVRNNGTFDVFDQGAAAELRTGVDPNGAAPDIQFLFNPVYLTNELWFDPDPFARAAVVPLDKTDAVSSLLHEFGHAFAFSGWRDEFTGTLPGNYESTFDELTTFDGTNFYFVGPEAMTLYGGPVPLTFGNLSHLGNAAPRPGSALISDLMNGVSYSRGTRYDISPLDFAVLSDTGVRVQPVPEPGTLLLVGLGIGASALRVRARERRDRSSRFHRNN